MISEPEVPSEVYQILVFPISFNFQTKIMFPERGLCFQNVCCFLYTLLVSKLNSCFQMTMFPTEMALRNRWKPGSPLCSIIGTVNKSSPNVSLTVYRNSDKGSVTQDEIFSRFPNSLSLPL